MGVRLVTTLLVSSLGLATAANANLIVNGDFELGNTGFTSGYTYVAPPGGNSTEGQYTVRNDPQNFNGAFFPIADRTNLKGKYLVVNGATSGSPSVWEQSVSVAANTTYDFESWVSTAVNGGPANLIVKINGVTLGSSFTAPALTGSWDSLGRSWASGSSTLANIQIVNTNLSVFPNDFYIDDISFSAQGASAVPEPATMVLGFSAMLVGLNRARKRR